MAFGCNKRTLCSGFTKDAGHEAKGELWGEEGEEPRRGVEARPDLVLLQVIVKFPVVVVQQPGELVHLNLEYNRDKTATSGQNKLVEPDLEETSFP